jgi:hypothetical protein
MMDPVLKLHRGLYDRKDNDDLSQRVHQPVRSMSPRWPRQDKDRAVDQAAALIDGCRRKCAARSASRSWPNRRGTKDAALAFVSRALGLAWRIRLPAHLRLRDAAAQAYARIRKHLEQEPWDACDLFREEIAKHPGDAMLLYWGAAHARSGASAGVLVNQAEAAGDARDHLADILSLRGHLWKDAYQRAPDKPEATTIAEQARQEYLAAFGLRHDVYPGINAATLALLLDDRAAAVTLAQEIVG